MTKSENKKSENKRSENKRSEKQQTEWQNFLLMTTLEAAVPLHIELFRGISKKELNALTSLFAAIITEHGDVLQYGGKTSLERKDCAQTFNSLARGLAALAYQPGGVTFAGKHWCVNHAECEQA